MTHAQDKIPKYIVLAHFADDTHSVICHYHHVPIEEEVNEMCVDYYDSLSETAKMDFIRFQLTEVKFSTTIDKLREASPVPAACDKLSH